MPCVMHYEYERNGTATSRTPGPSFWSRTISTSIARRHSTKPSRPPKPGGWSSASNGTTPQSTAVGSIWRSPNSASYRPSASTAGFPINNPRRGNRRLGARPQCQQHQSQLALHNPQCSYQTQVSLPFNLTEFGRRGLLLGLATITQLRKAVLIGYLQEPGQSIGHVRPDPEMGGLVQQPAALGAHRPHSAGRSRGSDYYAMLEQPAMAA